MYMLVTDDLFDSRNVIIKAKKQSLKKWLTHLPLLI